MAFTSPRYSCQIPKLAEGPPVLVRFVDPLPSPGFMRTAMAHPHHEVQLLLRPAVGTLRPNPLLRTWKFTSTRVPRRRLRRSTKPSDRTVSRSTLGAEKTGGQGGPASTLGVAKRGAKLVGLDEAEPLRTFGRTAGDLRRGVRYWMIPGTIARKRRARFADR